MGGVGVYVCWMPIRRLADQLEMLADRVGANAEM